MTSTFFVAKIKTTTTLSILKMNTYRRLFVAWSFLLSAAAFAADLPVKIVVPFGPGSGVDSYARVFAEAMREATGKTYIIDNRPGASMAIGSQEVSRAKADGNTLLFTVDGHIVNAALNTKLPYDSLNGFTPITEVIRSPGFVLIVGQNSKFPTVQALIEQARKAPGTVSYASAGPGTSTHIAAALFEKAAGIKLLHVPYKGSSLSDLMAGVIDLTFIAPSVVLPQIKGGRIRPLAISWSERIPELPNTPSYKELGLVDADLPAWFAVFGPPNMPQETSSQVFNDIKKAVQTRAFSDRIKGDGSFAGAAMTPAEFRDYVGKEISRYKQWLGPLGITME